MLFLDDVGIRKAPRAGSRMRDGPVGGHRRGRPRYSYNAGIAGLVEGTGYPARKGGACFGGWPPVYQLLRFERWPRGGRSAFCEREE
jgi:hypothetical protein